MIIAVDFDGTICESDYPNIGEANVEVIETLKERRSICGDKIILWTCRAGEKLREAIDWCREQGLEFDAVNENLTENKEEYGGDTRKVWADLYLDDKAVMFDAEIFKSVHGNPDKYQREALRTASGMSDKYPMLLNGLMGLNGEAGECIDILKKHYFQGHELDREHLAEELGDVAWYLAISAYALRFNLSEIFRRNIEKLRKRYPNGFESERSINRNEVTETRET